MITFSPIRTKRLTADLRELTIGDAEYICSLPPALHERNTSEFLKRVLQPSTHTLPGQVVDPRYWTVSERGAVMAHYMCHTSTDFDFAIGSGKYSDYQLDVDYVPSVEMVGVCGSSWEVHPLLGLEAEAIERLVSQGEPSRLAWWTGAMAFQLRRHGDDRPAGDSDAEMDEFLLQRVMFLREQSESDFSELLMAFLDAQYRLDHHLRVEFDEEGIIFAPKDRKEVPALPPARFPVRSMVSAATRAVLGVNDPAEA